MHKNTMVTSAVKLRRRDSYSEITNQKSDFLIRQRQTDRQTPFIPWDRICLDCSYTKVWMIKKITFKPVSVKNRLIRNLDALECKKRIVAPVMEIGMPAFDKRRRRVLHQIGHTWVWHRFCCAEGGLLGLQLSLENVLDKIVVGTGGSWFLRTDEQLIMVKSSKCPGSFSKSAGGLFTVTVYSDFTPNQRVDGRVSNWKKNH